MKKKEDTKSTSKERILQTAVQLFARQGFAGTGLRELAAQADVNLAMINYCFGSKKGLLKEILDDFFSGYIAVANKELTEPGTLHDKLTKFITQAVRYFDSHQEILLVAIAELPHDDQDIIDHKGGWAKQMASILEKEVCSTLNETREQNISATCLGPMLTSLMASRFLFAPVLAHVRGNPENPVDITSYTELILSIFLQGVESVAIQSPQKMS